METEAQILHRHQDDATGDSNFDPLEMDRYSLIQQLSRGLAETSSDVDSIKTLIQGLVRDADSLLVQQGRAASGLQAGLMRTRMVPFSRYVQRLSRVARQISLETGHRTEIRVEGAGAELDRQVVEKMLPCLEHMLRNAVIHGIEPPVERLRSGKSQTGTLTVTLKREGSQVIIEVGDDGRGLDLEAIRSRAVQRGLVRSEQILTMEQAIQLVFEPGFSTAESVTQSAGRGVGMDVVASQVRKLGGSVSLRTVPGQGTIISTRLPFSMAISQAMIVRVADELFAVPLPTVEGVVRIPRVELENKLAYTEDAFMESGGHAYRIQYLAQFLGLHAAPLPEEEQSIPLILVRAGESSAALIADQMLGSREIVVKSVGPQLATIQGLAGATILGDGRVALILDAPSLLRSHGNLPTDLTIADASMERHQTLVMVVDDSITVRRVTQRLLERNGMKVITASDGVDALEQLQEHRPDVMLLDIEMPRMDGYELASSIRKDVRLASIPIIMITSRVGQKHRAKAIEIGVDDYLGKPYQESQLLDAIEQLVNQGRTNVY
ncbi:MAG: hybrid sensor histidine kinase/response regulator [Anaerolineales bacterium]|nr:MAG: hybrid sensor histidine kinase/response regulator [Anaerolineales bacterium]